MQKVQPLFMPYVIMNITDFSIFTAVDNSKALRRVKETLVFKQSEGLGCCRSVSVFASIVLGSDVKSPEQAGVLTLTSAVLKTNQKQSGCINVGSNQEPLSLSKVGGAFWCVCVSIFHPRVQFCSREPCLSLSLLSPGLSCRALQSADRIPKHVLQLLRSLHPIQLNLEFE